MGFARRFGQTGKAEIPEGVKREVELLYINDIVNLTETNNIPKSMMLNLDQIPFKYVFHVEIQCVHKNPLVQYQLRVSEKSERSL